ncbi:MAG: antitoxin, partial [Bartonella sp.]|nr:antitoxin [Bartonella sp.]
RYTMAELLAASDYSQPQSPEEREWVDASAVGGELI